MSQQAQQPEFVPVLFTEREHADAAVTALRHFGLPERDLGVAVAVPVGPAARTNHARGGRGGRTWRGGAPLGSVGGLALVGQTLGETAQANGCPAHRRYLGNDPYGRSTVDGSIHC